LPDEVLQWVCEGVVAATEVGLETRNSAHPIEFDLDAGGDAMRTINCCVDEMADETYRRYRDGTRPSDCF